MKRRQFLAISAVSVLATGVNAGDELHVEYSDEVYEQALSSEYRINQPLWLLKKANRLVASLAKPAKVRSVRCLIRHYKTNYQKREVQR